MCRRFFDTVMLVVDLDLGFALNFPCDLVLLQTVTPFSTSTLALVLALAVTHVESL